MPKFMIPKNLKAEMNRSIKETPVTISGFIIGKFVKTIKVFLGTFFRFFKLTPAIVPIIVAKTADTAAIITVLAKDFKISPLLNNFTYHLKVNPDHTTRLFESLNEKITSIKIGKYKNRKISDIYILDNIFTLTISKYFYLAFSTLDTIHCKYSRPLIIYL